MGASMGFGTIALLPIYNAFSSAGHGIYFTKKSIKICEYEQELNKIETKYL